MLAEYFAIQMARELGHELFSGFSENVINSLLSHTWPGNIRELKNVVERSVYRYNNPHQPIQQLIIDPFESAYRPLAEVTAENTQVNKTTANNNQINNTKTYDTFEQFPVSLKQLSKEFEIKLIKSALAKHQFNQKKTAEALQLTYHQFRSYLKKISFI